MVSPTKVRSHTLFCVLTRFVFHFSEGVHYSKSFYATKLAFGFIWGTASILTSIFTVLPSTGNGVTELVVVAIVVTVLGAFIWFFWFLRILYRTNSRLRKVSFLATRYRQLSFRFILLLSTLTVIYLFASIGISLYLGTRASAYYQQITSLYSSLATLILVSVYGYSINLVYLPPNATFGLGVIAETSLFGAAGLFNPIETGRWLIDEDQDSDETKRNMFVLETAVWMFEFSWQVYYDPPGVSTLSGAGAMDLSKLEQIGYQFLSFVSDKEKDTHALIIRKRNRIVVAYRGTSSAAHVAIDLKSTTSSVVLPNVESRANILDFAESFAHKVAGEKASLSSNIRVHSGFLEAFQGIWPQTYDELVKIHDSNPGKNLHIIFTGHSLGGALSTLAAIYTQRLFNHRVSMYNFGSPRVGNHAFNRVYNQSVPDS
jgi:hypothetical protein